MKKVFKRSISMLMTVAMMLSIAGVVLADSTDTDLEFTNIDYTKSDTTRVILNNKQLSFDVAPQIIDGTTLVPFRTIFEALGLTVTWDGQTSTATGKNDHYSISFTIGSNAAIVNGESKALLQPAQVISGRTLIPLRFLSETLEYHVVWIEDSNLILISNKNIVEWRFGGHESIPPYKEYDVKYVNGESTNQTKYTGTNWTSSITLAVSSDAVFVGGSTQINIATNSAIDKTVSYASSNPLIADIGSDGVVTGISAGSTIITVTNCNGDTATCAITVNDNSTTSTIAMYPDYPTVPDFGVFANATLYNSYSKNSSTVYLYNSDFDAARIKEYCSLLEDCGYKYASSFDGGEGSTLVYLKGNIGVCVGLMEYHFAIMVGYN